MEPTAAHWDDEVINTAQHIIKALGGRWHGSYGMARCPAHKDQDPSLKARDDPNKPDGVDLHCFAGCDWRAVKDALRRDNLLPGWESGPSHRRKAAVHPEADAQARRKAKQQADRIEAAQEIWRRARPAAGTLAETYLRARGITISIPPTIRYVPDLKHGPTGLLMPTMVAAVQGPDGRLCGVHRTFLRLDGRAKANVSTPKMSLGHCAGGAIRLAAAASRIGVAEGIETALSVMQAISIPTWAALSTSGLKALLLPPLVREVIVLADGDEPGEKAAQDAAQRFVQQGRKVRIARPPEGKDFNDLLSDVA